MAIKSGVFAGKGIGRDPKDAVRVTIYLTRDEHRRMKRLLFQLEEKGIRISLTAFTRAALRRATKKLEAAPQPLTQEEALALIEN
jgi:predicted nucleic acid-binding protein